MKRVLSSCLNLENWRDILESDECHFTISYEGMIRIIQKPGKGFTLTVSITKS